ncbi:ECF transporter S component [Blastococcus sp. LR1]|uniref:ECF transporter S component n=1 Tax=Blastococcus sp. LR1 TaxID=2877000 RepID=UPI001CC924C9|nr:ECF transporter S component [Blastococcus sp. LR1]MCA0146987.1 ECF transporter S component [Blastococcus sp. LR1]
MAQKAVHPSSTDATVRSTRWRTVDIVVTAVLGVAFGVVFWAWGLLWAALDAPFSAFPPAQAVMYGVWLLPAVLAPLIVRKAGAGLFAELVASIVSALLGSAWGTLTIVYGLLQGAAGELGYAAFAYRRYGWPQALLSALCAGAMAAALDLLNYYPDWAAGWKTSYLLLVAGSTMVIAGIGGMALTRALAASGALSGFASGRTRV